MIELMRMFPKAFTRIFLFLMAVFFLFYYHDNYLDIVWAKKVFFQNTAIILLVLSAVFGIPVFVQEWKQSKSEKINRTDLIALVFLFTIILSCSMSPAGSEAFWGNQGRMFGGGFLLLCLAVYYVISRYYRSSQFLIWIFLLANCAMWILVILNFFNVDVLHMYENLAEYQHSYFIGTMGNININSAYSGFVVSLMMVFYYLGEETITKRCFWVAVVLGIYVCFATRSDSWLLALFGAYVVILYFAMKNEEMLQKWWMLCTAFFCSSLGMKLTALLEYIAGGNHMCIQDLRMQHLLWDVLLNWKVLLAEFIILVLFRLILKSSGINIIKKHGNKIVLFCLIALIVGTLLVIFPLEDSFQNNRGYIWKRTVLNFKEFPLWQKLFGYGPNCFLQSMEERYGTEMRERYTDPFIDAHNEALQFLTVTGILGAVSYFGMQISLLASCIRSRKENTIALLGCVGIVSYMLQGLVNNPQVFTTPLFFIFLGIVQNKIMTQKP